MGFFENSSLTSTVQYMYNTTPDVNAQSFITAASITDGIQKIAINTLVVDLKGYGIWTKMKAIYPVVGGVAASHAVNLKTPGTYNLTFTVSGWTHSSTGMTPNGAAYADTNFNPTAASQTNVNWHVSFYSRTNVDNTGNLFGLSNLTHGPIARQSNIMYVDWPSQAACSVAAPGRLTLANTSTNAMFLYNATSSNVKVFKNTTTIGTGGAAPGAIPNQNILLSLGYTSCTNRYDSRQCAFASIGDGLTDAEAANLYTAVQKYQTILRRQV